MNEIVSLKATHGIHSSSKRQPDKTAVIFGACSVSYKELTSNMRKVSYAAFTNMNFQGNIAIVAENSIEYLEVLLGVTDVGVPVITINPDSTVEEIVTVLKDYKAKVLFIDENLFREAYEDAVNLVVTLGEKYTEWRDKHQEISQYPFIADSTIFSIIYTSTTSKVKAVKHSHRWKTMFSYVLAHECNSLREGDVTLVATSLSNSEGSSTALACLNNGGVLLLGHSTDPNSIMEIVEKYKVSNMFLVPTLLDIIISRQSCRKYNRSSLKAVISSITPYSSLQKMEAVKFFGDIVYDSFATAECGLVSILKPKDFKYNYSGEIPVFGYGLHSVGKPVSGSTIEIRDKTGAAVKMSEVGEVFAKTLTLFSGYIGNDTFTDLKDVDSEFVSTNCLGYIGWDGFLYLVGKTSEN